MSESKEKSDIQKGVEGKIREGKTGTSNENAEKQLKELENNSQPASSDASSSDQSKAKTP